MKVLSTICIVLISNLICGSSGSWFWNIVELFGIARSGDSNVSKANYVPITYETSCGVSKYQNISERIVGGVESKPNEFPWIISLQVNIRDKYYHNCAGTIVHSEFILTAGHCVDNIEPQNLLIVAGKYNLAISEEHEQKRTVAKVINDQYKRDTMYHDVALIKLNKPLILDEAYAVPGCLPTGHEYFTDYAIIAGWGLLKENGELPNVQRKVNLPLLEPDVCKNLYKTQGYKKFLHDCQICTLDKHGKDACQGDSGGPLMCYTKDDEKLYICAVVSWGVGCAQIDKPGVYTQVSCFTDWIMNTINSNLN